ncbi:transposase [Streptomyces olivochromogenes]|nr:transposase [Streptomyces olivochromogenes]
MRSWLCTRQIVPSIAGHGLENSGSLGRQRWVVDRTVSWLNGCRRLHRRYERFLASVVIAAVIAVAISIAISLI